MVSSPLEVKFRVFSSCLLAAKITVGYELETYVTSETEGNVTLTIKIFNPATGAPRSFSVIVSTTDGTASMLIIIPVRINVLNL